jgi:hypothetical protein
MREPLASDEAAEPQEPKADAGITIPEQRLVLLEALRERDARLALIYEGVIRVMGTEGLPDQLSLAAHGMRELMERLPVAFDVPLQQRTGVINLVGEVERDFARAQQRSSCRTSDGWQGPIDAPLAKLLVTVEKLVEDRQQYWPSRSEAAVELMNQLEPTLGRRSPGLVRPEAATWATIRRYFEQVSHHHHMFDAFETSPTDLDERIRTVEALLLNKLRPSTATDLQAIDELMNRYMDTANE